MSITTLYNKLMKQGFDVETVKLWNDTAQSRPGIIVRHDYEGIYPTRYAIDTHAAVAKIARQSGFVAEKRGYCTATLIY